MGFQNSFFADAKQAEPGIERYHIEYTSGAVGAIPTVLKRANGIKSIVRSNVGIVAITLNNPGVDFIDFVGFVEQATPAAGGACFVTVLDALPVITVTFRTNAFAAVDTLNGDVVYVSFGVITVKV